MSLERQLATDRLEGQDVVEAYTPYMRRSAPNLAKAILLFYRQDRKRPGVCKPDILYLLIDISKPSIFTSILEV